MKIDAMRLFAEVVKQGSYTRAADHLGVSKGHLSQTIRQLEKALNKQLLVRNTRVMRLTSAGEILYSQARQLTTFWQDTQALLDSEEEQLAGQIKCTAPMGVARYILWPIFHKIIEQQSEISVLMESSNTTHNLVSEDFDFAVRITNTPPEGMIARQLRNVSYRCCATPEFLHRHGTPTEPADLQHAKCLALTHWRNWIFYTGENSVNITPNASVLASDNELLKQACLQHQGIARLPDYMLSTELASGQLVPVLPEFQGEKRALYLIYPQLSARPTRVTMFIKALINTLAT